MSTTLCENQKSEKMSRKQFFGLPVLAVIFMLSAPDETHTNTLSNSFEKKKKLTGPSSCFGRKRILPSKALADPNKSLWALSSLHRSFLLSISGLQGNGE